VLNDKQSELSKLHRQRANLQRRMDLIDRQISRVGGGAMNGLRGGGGVRARNERSLLDTIEGVLTKAGKPLSVSAILEGVHATGYRSGSANFRGIVNQTLIKDKRFGQVSRGVYGLKSAKK